MASKNFDGVLVVIRKKIGVVGMGVHGIHLGASLIERANYQLDDILLVDPMDAPVQKLKEYFRDCGTQFLRSGKEQHLDPNPKSLINFCRERNYSFVDDKRPTVRAWLEHAKDVVRRYDLMQAHVKAWATWFERKQNTVVLRTTAGEFEVDKLVLAMGQQRPFIPEFAARLQGSNPRVCSIFDNDFEGCNLPSGESAVVVGSGITSGQACGVLTNDGQRKVTLLTRRKLSNGSGKTSTMDWLGKELREKLCSMESCEQRDLLLKAERDRGTMPTWEQERIETLMSKGLLEHRITNIAHVIPEKDSVTIVLRSGEKIETSLLVLATGMVARLQNWVIDAGKKAELPFYHDEVPKLDINSHWGGGIYLSGVQAMRSVGPFAHNIVGGMILANSVCDDCS